MMSSQPQTIPCPTPHCTGQIIFDTYQLLQGASFACPTCGGAVRLSGQSKEQLSQTMEKFDAMKQDILKMKEDNNMS